jgi:hypothetical protein
MASAKKRPSRPKKKRPLNPEPTPALPSWQEDVPAGATVKAFQREPNGGRIKGSPLGDRHAAGTPAGGDELGGLAGSNVGDGAPVVDEDPRDLDECDNLPPFAGPSGGAVGGTPAEGRAAGGHVYRHEITPGHSPGRGDSTIGAD